MNDYEYEITMLNKLLNRIMKKDFKEFLAARINPLQYIANRENCNIYCPKVLEVNIKLKNSPTITEKLIIRNELLKLLNILISFVGAYSYAPIDDIKLRFI